MSVKLTTKLTAKLDYGETTRFGETFPAFALKGEGDGELTFCFSSKLRDKEEFRKVTSQLLKDVLACETGAAVFLLEDSYGLVPFILEDLFRRAGLDFFWKRGKPLASEEEFESKFAELKEVYYAVQERSF